MDRFRISTLNFPLKLAVKSSSPAVGTHSTRPFTVARSSVEINSWSFSVIRASQLLSSSFFRASPKAAFISSLASNCTFEMFFHCLSFSGRRLVHPSAAWPWRDPLALAGNDVPDAFVASHVPVSHFAHLLPQPFPAPPNRVTLRLQTSRFHLGTVNADLRHGDDLLPLERLLLANSQAVQIQSY